ncbi:hypothetical protein ERJ75_000129800 [Trypanosoma vivax]|nr:hypothetical protein ERJ75_000129800 [Trypanosoma vivax]
MMGSEAVSSSGGRALAANGLRKQFSPKEERAKQTRPGVSQKQPTAATIAAMSPESGSGADPSKPGAPAASGENNSGSQSKEISEEEAPQKPNNEHSPGASAKENVSDNGEALKDEGRFEAGERSDRGWRNKWKREGRGAGSHQGAPKQIAFVRK